MKNPHAVALGRLGGLARAKNLSPERLSAIGKKAGRAKRKKKRYNVSNGKSSA